MNLNAFEQQIKKTGFVLEYHVGHMLEAAGWNVINNKYYIDDHEESVREIDLVAYKVGKVQHFSVYTTLIISCKKSEASVWALLSKDINLRAVNIDWWPLHVWSNDKAMDYQFLQENAKKNYHKGAMDFGVTEVLRAPSASIFAFQEMNRESGSPQNDKAIFSAITSLMKAQAYEISSLPRRKKNPSIYQFNLLSVVDADLIRLHFDGANITATQVKSEHYIARYIIQKQETFARIHFVKASDLGELLDDYGRLHNANCNLTSSLCSDFYAGIIADWKRTAVLLEQFRKEMGSRLRWKIPFSRIKEIDFDLLSIKCSRSNERAMVIDVPLDFDNEDAFAFLNGDEGIRTAVSAALRKVYRFEGTFRFEPSIPF
jgi:hypothetical protein